MMNGFGLMLDTNDRKEALRQVRKWVDKELGEPTTSIKVEGNKTTVTLPDGRVGVSRCNPCDKFDIITGIRVALDDIEKKSRKLNTVEKILLNAAMSSGCTEIEIDDLCVNFHKPSDNYTMSYNNDDIDAFDWLEKHSRYSIMKLLRERS